MTPKRTMTNSFYTISLPKIRLDSYDDLEVIENAKIQTPAPPSLIGVNFRSAKNLRRAVYTLARNFRREFEYDFVQYGVDGDDRDETCRAFLWARAETNTTGQAFGGCCFRRRDWEDAEPGYCLTWIWMHPYMRNKGFLTESWPYFKERFGDFTIEPPISHAMEGFLRKQGQKSKMGGRIMDIGAALDLLHTNIDDLDESIQEEIGLFEEWREGQCGTFSPDQQVQFDALIARIQQHRIAIDDDTSGPSGIPEP